MNSELHKMKVSTEGNEVVFTRSFTAPRRLMFRSWTDPKLLEQWWGPHGFTIPICEVDLRQGGVYRIVMRSVDGIDYPLKGAYLEIKQPERLVITIIDDGHPIEWQKLLNEYRQTGMDEPALKMVLTVTFAEQGDETLLTILIRFASITDRDATLKMGAAEGWSQSLERLETLLQRI
jgi:uncharacterized protein YndB with AHSA1/START domain